MISSSGGGAQRQRKKAAAQNRPKRRHLLHLAHCVHLKLYLLQRPEAIMQKLRTKLEFGDGGGISSSELPFKRELSVLKRSRSLRDPAASPSCGASAAAASVPQMPRNSKLAEGPNKQKNAIAPPVAADYDDDGGGDAHQNPYPKSAAADGFEGTEGESSLKESCSTDVSSSRRISKQIVPLRVHTPMPVTVQATSENDHEDDDENSSVVFRRNHQTLGGGCRHPHLLLNAIKKLEIRKQEGLYGAELLSQSNYGMLQKREGRSAPSVLVDDHHIDGGMDSDREGFPYGCSYTGRLRASRCRGGARKDAYALRQRNNRASSSMKKKSSNGGGISGAGNEDEEADEEEEEEEEEHVNWRAGGMIKGGGAGVKDGCGIPWNWSRSIKGNSLCCIAGSRRNGASGHGHSTRRRAGKFEASRGRVCISSTTSTEETIPGTLTTTTEMSDSSVKSDSDSFPLLDYGESGDEEEEEDEEEEGILRRGSHGAKYTSQSLSDKYAPESFQEIVGQAFVSQALSNAMSRGRIAAMYMFCGPRGVGKTSCARVLAMGLNCSSSLDGKSCTRPCGSCVECRTQKTRRSSSFFKELSASSMDGSKGIRKLLLRQTMRPSLSSAQYRVIAVNDCHMLSTQAWDAVLKVVGSSARNNVFVFCTSSSEKLPHSVMSGCQKFVFSKIKEADIVSRLRMIAGQEGLEVEAEALRLIASECNGSLRDAETMFDQLTLLGQRISLAMAQELMGIVPDGLLVDLLDFALSADTVNTVQNLKELITSGVDPSNLMSQLACLITSVLAGGYQIPNGRHRRKFFRKTELGKDDMERLRQALRTLSEAEKQLRGCSDQTTWLAAALLQFAPDQSYLLPSSSYETSCTASSRCLNTVNTTPEMNSGKYRQVSETPQARSGSGAGSVPKWVSDLSDGGREKHMKSMAVGKNNSLMTNKSELEEVWQRILDAVHSSNLRKFLQLYGKLVSLSLQKGFALAVLQFCQSESVSRAERSKASIAHAFQVALGCPADVKMQFDASIEGQKRWKKMIQALSGDQSSISGSPLGDANESHGGRRSPGFHYAIYQSQDSVGGGNPSKPVNPSETTEMATLDQPDGVAINDDENNNSEMKLENAWLQGEATTVNLLTGNSSGTAEAHDRLTRKKVGFVNQQDECRVEDTNVMAKQVCRYKRVKWINFVCNGNSASDCGTDQRQEDQNLCLEPRSTSLLCWHIDHEKEDQLEKTRPRFLWRLCSCVNSKHT